MRDLLLGLRPKDFDVATDARPEELRGLFRSCRLIGRRFRLAHVRVGREIVEVATFRGSPGADDEEGDKEDRVTVNGRIVRDNVYGTLEEDVWRRDFTVNGLYYSIDDFSVIDYVGGMEDLESRSLRLIGDPEVRVREDPVRMLRALRFAAKLDFSLSREVSNAVQEFADLLSEIPPARLYEETLKLFLGGAAVKTYDLLYQYDMFGFLFPDTDGCIRDDSYAPSARLVRQALANTDTRIAQDKPVTPAFLFAALLWPPLKRDVDAYAHQGLTEIQAMETAGSDTVERQSGYVAFPRRFSLAAREIWTMQPRLMEYRGKRALGLLKRPRFRAAYDFLLLRAEAGEEVKKWADWWTRMQETDDPERGPLLDGPKGRRRRRRREQRAPAA